MPLKVDALEADDNGGYGLKDSALRTQDSGLRTQDSALRTQHSGLSTQHSALSTQHSALSTQHSRIQAPSHHQAPPLSPNGQAPTPRTGSIPTKTAYPNKATYKDAATPVFQTSTADTNASQWKYKWEKV
ncbi:polysialic acid O-acetyltransferase [Venturia nashicola]|uniref:Polysialic acid O-acetyltransferase n=1 Tax=Venturia nashicola TaxID=86259 RepID=A0A4Z1PCE1_9PEZI|nr:polysialic acid O-acetyltransferase [Venturia nashicola]